MKKIFQNIYLLDRILTNSNISRKRLDVFSIISKLTQKAVTFRTHSKVNIEKKIKPFLEVCDISKVDSPKSKDSPDIEKSSPLSPKRPESPVVLEEGGRGKR